MTSLIPTHAAEQVADGVSEYLATSFSLTEKRTAEQLRSFLLSPETGMFNGPYVRTRLPYAPAEGWEGTLGWLPSWFKPYRHQAEAFKRLTSYADGEERRPEPTLVVTGTGSGKTESFLYPILDHCRRLKALGGHGGATGIKALILYPMNALAADQERRLATLITSNPELADVTAGIYTGENPGGKRTRVSENGLINDRSAMRSTPPDILLTNYKMLDQLLLRESDRSLWEKSARTLQYLALDEFHTYDSAQGTDVAMLLRRLGLMLKKYQGAGFLTEEEEKARPLGRVTPVATSATLGEDSPSEDSEYEDSDDAETGGIASGSMLDFAFTIFGERFDSHAIVGETKLSVDQWRETVPDVVGVPRARISPSPTPGRDGAGDVVAAVQRRVDGGEDYTQAVHTELCARVFGCGESVPEAIAAMAENELAQSILRETAQPVPLVNAEREPSGAVVPALVERLFGSLDGATAELMAEFTSYMLSEMAYLRAEFGREHGWEGKKIPGVEVHLWVRELSRLDRAVGAGEGAAFRWSDDGGQVGRSGAGSRGARSLDDDSAAVEEGSTAWLPACYCRHCGRSGWMIAMQPGDDALETDPGTIRRLAVSNRERTRPLIDATSEMVSDKSAATGAASRVRWLNLDMGTLGKDEPDEELRELNAVAPVLTHYGEDAEEAAEEQRCPSCGEDDAIRFVGSSIATLLSVALSNLFGMEDLDAGEKKTLVFTDSVQDAAHRAGFVQSRARVFTLRSKIHEAVTAVSTDAAADAGAAVEMSLDEIAERMIRSAAGVTRTEERARRLYELVPPELTHHAVYRHVWDSEATKGQRQFARERLRERLSFDLLRQFGDQVDLGRSLVTTGTLSVSVAANDEDLLAAARDVIGFADDAELLTWVRGVLEYMRAAGGIYHEWLRGYLFDDCNPWQLARKEVRAKGIPSFVKGGEPKFPRSGPALKDKNSKFKYGAQPTTSAQGWYARWTARIIGKSAPDVAGTVHSAANVVTGLFDGLVKRGVVRAVETRKAGTVYYLEPQRVIVREEPAAEVLECSVCGFQLGVADHARTQLVGARCFTLECTGRFTETAVEDNYYQELYRSHGSRTIVSAEHTGLLSNKTRKTIEDQFKLPVSDQAADAPNVLVATPTLEMGIDIGDLSTVMLSSLPPSVANYVQRVGRAGRLSGNSLVVALARGRGRSLAKLEHPLETIAGAVTPPAAFLSARDIMHRQFVAYLFDNHGFGEAVDGVRRARDVFSKQGPSVIDALLEHVDAGVSTDIDRFIEPLKAHVSDDVLAELRAWAVEGGLQRQIVRARDRWNSEFRRIADRYLELDKLTAELQRSLSAVGDADDELAKQYHQADIAKRFTDKQRQNLSDEYWISALERFGLFPNFTLLDEAVDFHLSVSSYNEKREGYDVEPLEYSRGVSSALTELAPGNTFYVRGVGAVIDQIELEKDARNVEQWRVCPACSYSEPVLSVGESRSVGACPECGAAAYADRAQVIDVVQMSKVYASVDQERSAITESTDQRTEKRYQVQMSFNIPEGGRGPAWYLEGTGFGMHYLPHVSMRWMNLGMQSVGGNKRLLGGAEMEAPLFRICRHCGHLDSKADNNRWQDHAPWCPHRNAFEEDNIRLALGRTLDTQAVLVHLPQLLVAMDDSTLPSLVAALRYGFKAYLGGNPDHLDIAPVRVVSDGQPVEMLLIHDTVPGGTGYLAQFTDPRLVREMCELVYQRLVNCHCADEDRLACPSCLLPYAGGSRVTQISRAAAVSALRKILMNTDRTSPDADIAEATWDGKITEQQPVQSEQSKLETRFVQVFQQALEERGVTVTQSRDSDSAYWAFSFPGAAHTWTLREQVDFGFTRPDFVLSTEDPDVRDIVVYLDGARYHRSNRHNRVAGDFDKRNRLYEGEKLPWTITWRDLETFMAVRAGADQEAPAWANSALKPRLQERMTVSGEKMQLLEADPTTLLLAQLKEPTYDWSKLSGAAYVQAAFGGKNWSRTYMRDVDVAIADGHNRVTLYIGKPAAGLEAAADSSDEVDPVAWQLFVGLSNLAYLSRDRARVSVRVAGEDDGSAEVARGSVVEENIVKRAETDRRDPAWQEVRDEFEGEDDILAALAALEQAGVPAPDVDSIGQEIGEVPALAVWASPSAVLIEPDETAEAVKELRAKGYAPVFATPELSAEAREVFGL